MDEHYALNLAKTEYREGFNTGDLDRILQLFGPGYCDFSEDVPSFYGPDAHEALRIRLRALFRQYDVQLAVVIGDFAIHGDVAAEWGWHKFTLTAKSGGEPQHHTERYLQCWRKHADGWKIEWFMSNAAPPKKMVEELPEAMPVGAPG